MAAFDDPFALAGFITLVLLIPFAMLMLFVVARRSADSVWDGLAVDRRYRTLQRTRRMTIRSSLNSSSPDETESRKPMNITVPSTNEVDSPSGVQDADTTKALYNDRPPTATEMPSLTFEQTYDAWHRASAAGLETPFVEASWAKHQLGRLYSGNLSTSYQQLGSNV